jgi:Kef-type K+ transport system membrane component KefB
MKSESNSYNSLEISEEKELQQDINHNNENIKENSSSLKLYIISNKTEILNILSLIIIGIFIFIALIYCFGDEFTPPNGRLWSVSILWLTSYCFSYICIKASIPPLLGMLISGILLKNLPSYPVDSLPTSWASTIRVCGLALILIRSGLNLDIPAIIKAGWVCFRLTIMPGVTEALLLSGLGVILFDMPYILALSMGFILAAVSPAVVVSGMFELESKGYGVKEGIPSLIIASASFDGVVAISGFSICIASAIPSSSASNDTIIDNLNGIFNFIGGIIVGYIAGYIISLTILWNSQIKRTVVTLAVGLMCSFIGTWYGYGGGGALAGLVMAVVGAKNWRVGIPMSLSDGPNLVASTQVGHELAKIWNIFAQPLLFAVIGSSVNFRSIDMDIIPLALLAVMCGMLLRVCMAFTATYGAGFNLKTRIFIALSWIPKATVQAALGSVPLDLVLSKMSPTHPDYDKYVKWGNDIVVIAVVAILITAPIGLIVFDKLGPLWLEKKEEIDDDIDNINEVIEVNEINMINVDNLSQASLEEGNNNNNNNNI